MLPGLAEMVLLAGSAGGGGGGGGAVSVSPATITRSAGTKGTNKTLTTAAVTVTAPAGSTFSWARTSGSAVITVVASTSAITAFTGTLAPDDEFTAVFTCTVTDPSGQVTLVTVTVTLTLIFIDIHGTL